MKPLSLLLIGCLSACAVAGDPIVSDPAKVDMNKRTTQLQEQRFGMFICWSFSTFSGYEWTPGVEDVRFFNPSGFDPDQWCRVAKEAGMGYILFLTKHHDGFCLWDTKTTDRKVTQSLLKKDVLAEVKKACDKHGLKLALYFSEGDWSWSGQKNIHKSVARTEIKKAQLRELLTQYGPIEYIWFDHAVGTGGLSHADTAKFVKSLQPGCFVGFNHGEQAGADIRLGERGKPAPLTDNSAASIGSGSRAKFMQGYKGYRLAEFTYPILEGQGQKKFRGAQWFYSLPENDQFAASSEKIYRDYLGAKKYGNIFSLDVGPDRNGKIRSIDVKTLRKVGQYIRGEIKLPVEPISRGKKAAASSVWQSDKNHSPKAAFDGNPNTRWGAAENTKNGWLAIDLGEAITINRAMIDEGDWNRITQFKLQYQDGKTWKTIVHGKTIGPKKSIKFNPVKARHFRLLIIEANGVPTLLELELYKSE